MKKFIAGLIAAISTLALTLIAVLLAPDVFLQKRWRMISTSLGFCAVVGIVLQGMLTKRDEDAERKEREQLYKLVRTVLRTVREREQARPSGGSAYLRFYVDTTTQAEKLLDVLSHSDATDEAAADRALNAIDRQRRSDLAGEYGPRTNSRETALNLLERLTLDAVVIPDRVGGAQ